MNDRIRSMYKHWKPISVLIALAFGLPLNGQTFVLDTISETQICEGLNHIHLQSPSQTNAPQNIHILSISLESISETLQLKLIQNDQNFFATSDAGEDHKALAAINGGFFDVKMGGSVSFIEENGKKVSLRSMRIDVKQGEAGNINAALIMSKSGKLLIEKAKPSIDYLNSDNEEWVLVAGPLVIHDGKREDLLDNAFVKNRHPRTVVAETSDRLLLITIDGRHEEAVGMNLLELQDCLMEIGCINGINLDGGGSTTMWLDSPHYTGVANCPSDNRKFDHLGERKVANAILILKK